MKVERPGVAEQELDGAGVAVAAAPRETPGKKASGCRLEWMGRTKIREAREVAVAGPERTSMLDGERGKIGVRDELAACAGVGDEAREHRRRSRFRHQKSTAAPLSLLAARRDEVLARLRDG